MFYRTLFLIAALCVSSANAALSIKPAMIQLSEGASSTIVITNKEREGDYTVDVIDRLGNPARGYDINSGRHFLKPSESHRVHVTQTNPLKNRADYVRIRAELWDEGVEYRIPIINR